MQHRPLLFVDIETTGGSATDSRVLEIGALRVEAGKVVATMKQLIDPEEHVPAWITQITGITSNDVKDSPVFRSIAKDFQELGDGAIFVAHNVNFDYSFLRMEFARLNEKFAMDKLCTVRLSRALFPEQKSHRLDEVIRVHGYEVENRHRAYDDAHVLYRFFSDQLDARGLELFRTMNKLISYAR